MSRVIVQTDFCFVVLAREGVLLCVCGVCILAKWLVISAKKNYRIRFAEFKHINLNL
ncbi:MAG TPA: hypothetical protein PLI06_04090 [Methanofastidiosum sp.]|nr:hypothetical protein [Methanofastidiosum sp.]